MGVKKSKMIIVMIGLIAITTIAIVLLKKNVTEKVNINEVVNSSGDNGNVGNEEVDNKNVDNENVGNENVGNENVGNEEVDKEKLDKKESIETKIEKYIKECGKEYSNELISGENSFYVGGIGKSIKSYDLDKFNPEDFDIYGLIESVPESCDKFGAEVIIDDKDITVNLYTEKDKFYKDE